jgi:uncharacterized membrane protein/protein-disulfide isomerase
MSSRRRALVLGFALLGLGASSYSAYVHYRLLTDPAYASACDIGSAVSCSTAYESQYGSFFGVPVALEGIVFFIVVGLLAGVAARPASRAAATAPAYIFAMAAVGLAFSIYLAFASYVILKTFCILCALTYVAVIGTLIVSGGATTIPMTTLPRRAFRDLRILVSTPLALILMLLVAAGSAAAIAWFPKAADAAVEPQAAMPSLTAEQRAQLDVWWKAQPRVDLPVPRADAKVQIVVFTDYQCPGCRFAHDVLRRVLSGYDRSAVELVQKQFPLEGECNPLAPGGNHYMSCEAAAAFVMARGTGFQQKLDDWLFDNQPALSREAIKKAAKDIAGIEDFDARYPAALEELRKEAQLGGVVRLKSTPTVYLNGRMIAGAGNGLPPAQYIDALIGMELKRK